MDVHETNSIQSPPPSCSNYWINLLCLIFFCVGVIFLRLSFPQMDAIKLTGLSLLVTAIPLWLYDFLRYRFDELHARSGHIFGARIQQPKLIPCA